MTHSLDNSQVVSTLREEVLKTSTNLLCAREAAVHSDQAAADATVALQNAKADAAIAVGQAVSAQELARHEALRREEAENAASRAITDAASKADKDSDKILRLTAKCEAAEAAEAAVRCYFVRFLILWQSS